jgi:transposase InsO family protein
LGKPLSLLCKMTKVSKSGYYKWLKQRGQQARDYEDFLLIKSIFDKGKKKLGWRNVQMNLKNNHNITMNHKKIRRIMNRYGLFCHARRKNPYKQIMKKTQEHHTFENILNRNFDQAVPKKALCTDITYLYYGIGRRAYLSVIKDIATGEALSWELSVTIDLEFVLKTVDRLGSLDLPPDALIHSDQGVHYTHPLYIEKVKELNILQSMSRKGNCIDNAPMESFFGHLKDELEIKTCRTFEELIVKVDEYMQYYNHHRYQWGLKKMTPVQYRDHLLAACAA